MEVNYEPLSEPNTLYHSLAVDIKVLLGSLQKNQVTILYEEVKVINTYYLSLFVSWIIILILKKLPF